MSNSTPRGQSLFRRLGSSTARSLPFAAWEVWYARLVFSGHARRRMFERGIRASHVRSVIESGEIIARYPDDKPLPSFLILGFLGEVPSTWLRARMYLQDR